MKKEQIAEGPGRFCFPVIMLTQLLRDQLGLPFRLLLLRFQFHDPIHHYLGEGEKNFVEAAINSKGYRKSSYPQLNLKKVTATVFGGPIFGLDVVGMGPNLMTGGGIGDAFLMRLLARKVSESSDPRGEC